MTKVISLHSNRIPSNTPQSCQLQHCYNMSHFAYCVRNLTAYFIYESVIDNFVAEHFWYIR